MTMSDDPLENNRSPHLKILLDILLIAVLAVIVYIAAYFLNMTGALLSLLENSGAQHASAVIFVAIFLVLGLVYFVIRRWHELTQMSEEVQSAQNQMDRTNAKLMLINNITRYDMLNELTQLHKDLEKTGTTPEVARVEEAISRIRRQIKFTKEYQDIGATTPAWQNAADAIMRAKVGIDLGNVSFEMDIHDVEIYADPLLEKVFYYLLSNSLKYGGSNLSMIRIYRRKEEERLVIIFEDNGVGIAKELKGGLFPKEWGSRKHAGYGLFLIRETLAVTGITIWESGNPGEGAKFEISVPKGVFRQV